MKHLSMPYAVVGMVAMTTIIRKLQSLLFGFSWAAFLRTGLVSPVHGNQTCPSACLVLNGQRETPGKSMARIVCHQHQDALPAMSQLINEGSLAWPSLQCCSWVYTAPVWAAGPEMEVCSPLVLCMLSVPGRLCPVTGESRGVSAPCCGMWLLL